MKKTILTITALTIGSAISQGAIVRLDNVGPSTGANLDEINAGPTTIAVPEVPGLSLTVHAITGSGLGTDLNSTATSLGINAGDGGDDTDAFDATFGESVTFSFSQAVSITQLDLTNFEDLEIFEFGSTTINYGDLTNQSTDIYDFSSPLLLAADEQFTISASSGTIGIEGLTLTAVPVPEPSTTALIGFGGIALILRRRQ